MGTKGLSEGEVNDKKPLQRNAAGSEKTEKRRECSGNTKKANWVGCTEWVLSNEIYMTGEG